MQTYLNNFFKGLVPQFFLTNNLLDFQSKLCVYILLCPPSFPSLSHKYESEGKKWKYWKMMVLWRWWAGGDLSCWRSIKCSSDLGAGRCRSKMAAISQCSVEVDSAIFDSVILHCPISQCYIGQSNIRQCSNISVQCNAITQCTVWESTKRTFVTFSLLICSATFSSLLSNNNVWFLCSGRVECGVKWEH